MIRAYTKKGREIYFVLNKDCDENKGGWWVEIYLDYNGDRYDDFCIHVEDCDCSNQDEVEKFAKEYISNINEY